MYFVLVGRENAMNSHEVHVSSPAGNSGLAENRVASAR